MEQVILTLKKVEEEADAIESESKKIATEIVRRTEEETKRMEREIEEEAQREGERLLSARLEDARRKAEEIKRKAEEEGHVLKIKAEGNLEKGVDEIVKIIVNRFKKI